MSVLEEWDKAKEQHLNRTPDPLLIKAGDNLATDLRTTKGLLSEALAVIEMDLHGRIKPDEGSLLQRIRSAL